MKCEQSPSSRRFSSTLYWLGSDSPTICYHGNAAVCLALTHQQLTHTFTTFDTCVSVNQFMLIAHTVCHRYLSHRDWILFHFRVEEKQSVKRRNLRACSTCFDIDVSDRRLPLTNSHRKCMIPVQLVLSHFASHRQFWHCPLLRR